jgi:hypothetical protein
MKPSSYRSSLAELTEWIAKLGSGARLFASRAVRVLRSNGSSGSRLPARQQIGRFHPCRDMRESPDIHLLTNSRIKIGDT